MNLDIGAANDGDFVSLSCFCRNYQSRIRHWIGMFVRRNERHELGGALSAFLILSMVQNIKKVESGCMMLMMEKGSDCKKI